MPEVQYLLITPEEAGQKIISFLQRKTKKNIPYSALMRWIRTGQVRIDGKRAKPFDRLKAGQKVRIPPYAALLESENEILSHQKLDIVYEDEQFLVVNKPSGLPVHPGSGHKDSVTQRLRFQFAEDPFPPTPVHRLDKDTSGLLLVARSFSFLRTMQKIWPNKVNKLYLAWVRGVWPYRKWVKLEDRLLVRKSSRLGKKEAGIIHELPLRKNKERTGYAGKKVVISSKGKLARSWALLLRAIPGYSLLVLRLETGRTHQLRVQMAMKNHPIVGDPCYGHHEPSPLLLHAWQLSWPGYNFVSLPSWPQKFKVMEEWLSSNLLFS
ncbi:RluA family pseudouridine synthase [Desulfovulcanus sp.]